MSQALFRLDGKTAFVSGARGHLGAAMTRALAGAGAHVIINGRDDAALAAFESDLRGEGFSVSRAAFDVADGDAVRRFFSGLSRLDILVNNAVNMQVKSFAALSDQDFTRTYASRSAVNFADFLVQTDAWLPVEEGRVYAILDNLSAHRATDVLLFALHHERWEFVFQPKYAAYLNLIGPRWKILRSLALKGRRFETWEEVEEAIREATEYWNGHRHPFVWGRRRRHKRSRPPGLALLPKVA